MVTEREIETQAGRYGETDTERLGETGQADERREEGEPMQQSQMQTDKKSQTVGR